MCVCVIYIYIYVCVSVKTILNILAYHKRESIIKFRNH